MTRRENRDFQYVCRIDEIEAGQSRAFSIKGEGGKDATVALFHIGKRFSAISNLCVHKGGPLNEGTLDGDTIPCPWHGWKYSIVDGKSPHEGGDSVDSYETKIIDGTVFVSTSSVRKGRRVSRPHEKYARLEQSVNEYLMCDNRNSDDCKIRILGISTTNANDKVAPRQSTSDKALGYALIL